MGDIHPVVLEVVIHRELVAAVVRPVDPVAGINQEWEVEATPPEDPAADIHLAVSVGDIRRVAWVEGAHLEVTPRAEQEGESIRQELEDIHRAAILRAGTTRGTILGKISGITATGRDMAVAPIPAGVWVGDGLGAADGESAGAEGADPGGGLPVGDGRGAGRVGDWAAGEWGSLTSIHTAVPAVRSSWEVAF